jgi:hypothetical protein
MMCAVQAMAAQGRSAYRGSVRAKRVSSNRIGSIDAAQQHWQRQQLMKKQRVCATNALADEEALA